MEPKWGERGAKPQMGGMAPSPFLGAAPDQ